MKSAPPTAWPPAGSARPLWAGSPSGQQPPRRTPWVCRGAVTLLWLIVLSAPWRVQGEVDAAAARQLLAAHQQSVLTVRGVLKVQPVVNGQPVGPEREIPVKATGTVVDRSGAVAACSFELNPIGALLKKPRRAEVRGQSIEYDLKSRLENLRLGFPDRSEWPARLAAEDEDLGVMLLAPEPRADEKLPVFEPVRWDEVVAPQPFTQYLVLDRGSESFRDAPLLSDGLVGAVLARPRRLYVQDLSRPHVFLGSPFYDLRGRLLGLGSMSLRLPDDPADSQMDSWPLPVILPAADIHEFVQRALKRTAARLPSPPPPAAVERCDGLAAATVTNLLRRWAEAVVVVDGSVKFNCGRCAREHEAQVHRLGVVVDAAGLVLLHRQSAAQGHRYLEQHLRLILADRREVPARILLDDDDVLLSVLAPTAPPEQAGLFQPVPLSTEATADLFDHVVILSRLGKDHRYLPVVTAARIMCRVTHPRPFYLANLLPAGPFDLGQPVFLPDGRLLGIVATEPQPQDSAEDAGLPGPMADLRRGTDARVVPAAALADLLRQARALLAKEADGKTAR